jgi:hypothetical protein
LCVANNGDCLCYSLGQIGPRTCGAADDRFHRSAVT